MAKASPTRIITGKVRASYFYGIVPAVDKNDDGTEETFFRFQIIIDKTDKDTLTKIAAAIKAATDEGVAKKWAGQLPAKLVKPLRDGDTETNDKDEPLDPAIYKGKLFMNVKSKDKPGILGPDGEPPYLRDAAGNPKRDDQHGGLMYDPQAIVSGDYIRCSLNFYAYSFKGKKGISAGLNNIQLLKKGERIGGRVRPEDEFADGFVDDEEEEVETGDPLAGLLG